MVCKEEFLYSVIVGYDIRVSPHSKQEVVIVVSVGQYEKGYRGGSLFRLTFLLLLWTRVCAVEGPQFTSISE